MCDFKSRNITLTLLTLQERSNIVLLHVSCTRCNVASFEEYKLHHCRRNRTSFLHFLMRNLTDRKEKPEKRIPCSIFLLRLY